MNEHLGGLLLVGSRSVSASTGQHVHSSMICASDSVTLDQWGSASRTVVVCGGDVRVTGDYLEDALVFARGNVTLARGAVRCGVIAGGKILSEAPPGAFDDSIFREGERTGLGILQYFDPAHVGLTVGPVRGGVRVEALNAVKPPAGLLSKGDVISAVGKVNVDSPEAFRRALRAALADGTLTVPMTVSRQGHTFVERVRVRR